MLNFLINTDPFLMVRKSIITNPFYIIRRGLYRSIKELAHSVTGDILDFGCGSKPYESLFRNSKSYIGLDIEVSGHSHQDSKVDVFYDGKKIPFQKETFDGIVCFEVVEHVFNIDDVLSEMHRVLKPGGKLLLSAPFAWDEHEVPYDFARYTSFGLHHLLEKHQFEVIESTKTTSYLQTIGQMWIAYLSQHVSPKNRILGKLFQIVIIFPTTSLVLLFDRVFPKRFDYYSNNVVLSKRI